MEDFRRCFMIMQQKQQNYIKTYNNMHLNNKNDQTYLI